MSQVTITFRCWQCSKPGTVYAQWRGVFGYEPREEIGAPDGDDQGLPTGWTSVEWPFGDTRRQPVCSKACALTFRLEVAQQEVRVLQKELDALGTQA